MMELAPVETSAGILRVKARELFNEFPAALILRRRDHDLDFDELIAASDALATKPQPSTARRAGRNLDGQSLAAQCGYIDLRAKHGLCYRQRHVEDKIV